HIAAGATQATLDVPIVDDAIREDDETVNFQLTAAHRATLGANILHALTILDDETTPTVGISPLLNNVRESSATVVLQVTLAGNLTAQTVRVHFTTRDDLARAGIDYVATSGTLVFTPPQRSLPLAVQLIDNATAQPARNFHVDLSAPENALLDADSANIVI